MNPLEIAMAGSWLSFSGLKLPKRWVLVTLALVLVYSDASAIETAHQRMLQEIENDFRRTAHLTGRNMMQPAVLAALRNVPREEFVPALSRSKAYINRPLSIGHGQTISQPYIVALMTDLLDLKPTDTVLEIGTGSGYQAALLAELVEQVYSIEILAALAASAEQRLHRLGYTNVVVKHGDGNYGWSEHAPFDAIIVTAGGQLPPALIDQLKTGGRLVIPIDNRGAGQVLTVISKDENNTVSTRAILPVRFVPITGNN